MDIDMDTNGLHVDSNAPMHSIWNVSTQSMPGLDASTIVPHESMLGGAYVRVDSPDISAESYDDADESLPQHVVFKRETRSPACVNYEAGSSDDERRLKRSIRETRTGGKSVTKEQRLNKVSKGKANEKKSRRHAFLENIVDPRDIYRDDKGRLHCANKEPTKKFVCNYPFPDDDELPEGSSICGKQFKRPEHRQRHRRTHRADKDYPCLLCNKSFNRNDNCWAHAYTHVHRPGKKEGRNTKFSLRQVISVLTDPKQIEKLLNDWRKDVGSEYDPDEEEDDNPKFMEEVEKHSPDLDFSYDVDEAIVKIRFQRM